MSKKNIYYFIFFIFIFIIQYNIVSYIKVLDICPDLIFATAVAVAVFEGSNYGAAAGFISGFFKDALFERTVGINALFGIYTGLFAGYISKRLFRENFFISIIITGFGRLIYNVLYYIIFKVGSLSDIGFTFLRIILPGTLYNIIVAIPVFFIIKAINRIERKPDNYVSGGFIK